MHACRMTKTRAATPIGIHGGTIDINILILPAISDPLTSSAPGVPCNEGTPLAGTRGAGS